MRKLNQAIPAGGTSKRTKPGREAHMNAKHRVWTIAGVAAASLLLAGFGFGADEPKPKAAPPLSELIVGAWDSGPVDTPYGKATQTFCFGADGKVSIHSNSSAGPMSRAGSYKVEGDRVTVLWPEPGTSVILRASWSGERLVLTDQSGQARSYARSSTGC
jgi:hypothetical protein